MPTYTIKDFITEDRGPACRECGSLELSISSRINGKDIEATVRCENGHQARSSWPIGTNPPLEVVRLLQV